MTRIRSKVDLSWPLTPTQRRYAELAATGMRSEDIGRICGVHESAVNSSLRAARMAQQRREAGIPARKRIDNAYPRPSDEELQRCRELIDARTCTRAELASKLGVGLSTLARWLTYIPDDDGHLAPPAKPSGERIAPSPMLGQQRMARSQMLRERERQARERARVELQKVMEGLR